VLDREIDQDSRYNRRVSVRFAERPLPTKQTFHCP